MVMIRNNIDICYEKYYSYLFRVAKYMTKRTELAEEMVNELFLDLINNNEVIELTTAKTWLVDRLIDIKSKRVSLGSAVKSEPKEVVYNHPSMNTMEDPSSLEEKVSGNSERIMIAQKIAHLPDEQSAAINKVLYFDESKTNDHNYLYGISALHGQLKNYYEKVYGGTNDAIGTDRDT